IRIPARYVEGRRDREAAGAAHVRPIEPVRAPGVAVGREGVVHVTAVAYRHVVADVEIGPARNDDHRGAAVEVMDDRARRLDHRAGRRAHDWLRPGCSLGGARESRNDQGCYKANDNCTHGASLVLVGQCSRLEPAGTAFPREFAFFPAMKRYWASARSEKKIVIPLSA